MYNIRRTSRQLGIRSEAGTRFEKGQDPNLTITGLKSALGLILDFTNSEIASDLIDHYPFVREGKTVLFNILSVKRFLGFDLSRQEIIDIFKRLKLDVVEKEKNQEELEIAIPTYRGDLNIEADLLEEVARLYGYSKIQPALPSRDLSAPKINSFSIFSRRIVDTLIKLGCDEISTYSFIDPVYYSELGLPLKECLTLSNPLSPELSVIRNTLVPSLITVAKNNAKKYSSFNLFEINRAIQTGTDANGIHLQPMHLAILCYNKKSDNLYTTIKGLIESLSAELNYVFMYDRNNIKAQLLSPIIHSNRSAVILTSKEQIGLIAEIKPSVLHIAGLEGRVSFIEINLEKLQPYYKPNKTYRKVSVFPSVYRDLSFWLNNTVSYQELVNTITALNINTLKAINLQDEFINPEKANTKSLTIRIELQDTLKTLTESDITPIIKKIVSSITNNLKATLRDSQAN